MLQHQIPCNRFIDLKQKDLVCVFKHCYLELECLYISIALLPGQVIVVLLRMQP